MKNEYLLIALLLVGISVTGCGKSSEKGISVEKEEIKILDKNIKQKSPSKKDQAKEITANDIRDGEETIRNYFDAINNKDLQKIEELLGDYKDGLFNKNKLDGFSLELISIEHPGHSTNNNIPPSSYVHNYGKKPFKYTSFYVKFKENGKTEGFDYLLIKENETSNWEIHDWGI